VETKTVGVIGAGTMGAGIALVCGRKGHHVKLLDANQAVLDKAQSYLQSILTKDVEKGKISEQQKNRHTRENESRLGHGTAG